jgi:uncharacterized repeat protein (TIGR03803 family)
MPFSSLPSIGLIQASDGNFYGVAQQGGANNMGTVFRITPSGDFTVLHTFSAQRPILAMVIMPGLHPQR